jgi:sarcosine oxidase
MKQYDCIVIGFGGVGSAALYHAAKKGWRVLGIDQFGPVHNRGSSHGQSRIIRQAYFEHPNYVPLAGEAFERWDELNKRHRVRPEIKPLFEKTGVLQIGRPESEVIVGVRKSAAEHDLKLESFSPAQIVERLPLLKVEPDHVGLLEPDAGVLRVEQCVAAHLAQAKKRGAELRGESRVESWRAFGDGVEVRTSDETFQANRLVISAGAWSEKLLGFPLGLKVVSKQQNWYQIDRVEQKLVNGFPVVFVEQNDGEQFYCIPEIDSLGMKVARHSGEKIADPDNLDRDVDLDDLRRNEAFLDQNFHHTRHRLVHHSTCMYTMSTDGHFVVDYHPEHDNVVFAAGLSGHGFKFVPVLGHRLVEMLDGVRDPALDFLGLSRFHRQGGKSQV